MDGEAQLLFVAIAVVALVASLAYWRQATVAALLLLLFEGALRKWLLPEAQAQLYLAKDVLLLGAYAGFFARKGLVLPVPQARPFVVLLAMAVAYGTVQLLNPSLPSLALGAVGWRSYFFYAPLAFLVPHLFASPGDLYRALRRFALLALPLAVLGIVQFYSPADSMINANVQHEPGSGGGAVGFALIRVRVGGTFSFVSGYSAYLLVASLLIGALLAAESWRVRGNVLLYASLAATTAAMFATGSRGPVYLLVAALALYTLLAAASGDLSLRGALRACLAAIVLAAALWYFLPEPGQAFYARAAGGDDALWRLASPFVEPFAILEQAGAVGFGIGTAHQSAPFLMGSAHSWWTHGILAEAEAARVMLELGVLGFALVFLLRLGLALWALRAALSLKSRAARSVAIFIALYLCAQAFGAVIFNPTANVLYWFAAGVLFALCRFEARGRMETAQRRAVRALRLHRSA
jgi:hypothetical protein